MFSKKWIVDLLEVDDIFSFSTMATEVSSHDVSIASVRSPLWHLSVLRFVLVDAEERRKVRAEANIENIEDSFELVDELACEKRWEMHGPF